MRNVVGLFVLCVTTLGGQQSPVAKTGQAGNEISATNLADATAWLERELKSRGLNLPGQILDPGDLDDDISVPGLPATPPTPPEPEPEPAPPIGPSPFMRRPQLEQFREALEKFRLKVEDERERRNVPMGTYKGMIGEYNRRVDLYREATKLLNLERGQ